MARLLQCTHKICNGLYVLRLRIRFVQPHLENFARGLIHFIQLGQDGVIVGKLVENRADDSGPRMLPWSLEEGQISVAAMQSRQEIGYFLGRRHLLHLIDILDRSKIHQRNDCVHITFKNKRIGQRRQLGIAIPQQMQCGAIASSLRKHAFQSHVRRAFARHIDSVQQSCLFLDLLRSLRSTTLLALFPLVPILVIGGPSNIVSIYAIHIRQHKFNHTHYHGGTRRQLQYRL
mmetsp:Transcript_15391/g.26963  ORF Transcript_15391/g.26963 Transcript_15391/m.26963 type:complete len:232 (-) Transcript_15391:451-1146(-)